MTHWRGALYIYLYPHPLEFWTAAAQFFSMHVFFQRAITVITVITVKERHTPGKVRTGFNYIYKYLYR